jgi:2,3-bisphosphoglycerate-independent phosphoglycerate mutase
MDRDNNWDRLARAEAVLFLGQGQTFTGRASELLKKLYSENIVDEKIEPYTILDSQGFAHPIQKNDGIFFFNFRADRARMLSTKIIEKAGIDNLAFVTLTEYEKGMRCDVAFAPVAIETTLANEVSKSGLSQAHVAETEKFAHATYFLNGGKETPHEKETHILVPSRKDVATHDLAPKMMAKEIADKVLEEIEKGTEFIFVNFANADMVGHTANVPAIIESVEEADIQLGRIVNELDRRGGVSIITADHGNAEMNIDQTTGEKHTAHTLNPVPFIITDKTLELKKGTLADIAPTTLQILKIKKPECMTGESLIAE